MKHKLTIMKALFISIIFFITGCHTPEKKEAPKRTNRQGAALMSTYKIEKTYWYVILSYDNNGTYYYCHSSSKPVSDFFNVKWKKINTLPVELVIAPPEDVLDVPLSDLPADVEVPIELIDQ